MCGKPFQKSMHLAWLPNALNASSFDLTIPEGRRLVLEEISGTAFMPQDVKLTSVLVVTSVGPSNIGENLGTIVVEAQFVGREDGSTNVPDIYVFSRRVLAFCEGPNAAEVLAARTPAAVPAGKPQGEVDMTVAGYLVDLG
jgi:hypothetical protein